MFNYRTLAIVVLAIVAFVATPDNSKAVQPPVNSTSQQHRYFVEYSEGGTTHVLGPYQSRKQAHAVVHSLRLKGYSAHVVRR